MRPAVHRLHRRWLTAALVAVLLLAQWATAAYACPRAGVASSQQSAAAVMAEVLPDCHAGGAASLDPELPALCKAHCDAGQQSVNSAAGVVNPSAPAMLAPLWVRALDVAGAREQRDAGPHAALASGPPAGTPPLYLALLVLRN